MSNFSKHGCNLNQILTSGHTALTEAVSSSDYDTIYYILYVRFLSYEYTMEPLLRGHPDERPTPLDNVNLNINVLIATPDERPPLLKGHISGAKGVASQEGFHCNIIMKTCVL